MQFEYFTTTADLQAAKSEYRELIKRYHPDSHIGDTSQNWEEITKAINSEWEIAESTLKRGGKIYGKKPAGDTTKKGSKKGGKTAAEKAEQVKAAFARINSIEDMPPEFASQFYSYSQNNCKLIYSQNPHATLVASFKKWKELGRTVKKGEHGLQILCPCFHKKPIKGENGEEKEEEYITYHIGYVFDISQTEGEEVTPAQICEIRAALEVA